MKRKNFPHRVKARRERALECREASLRRGGQSDEKAKRIQSEIETLKRRIGNATE